MRPKQEFHVGVLVVAERVLHRMRSKGLCRLPVVDAEGILAVDDILDLLSEELMDVVALSAVQRQKEERYRR